MNHWQDFKIGQKYRLKGWGKEKHTTCVGISLDGWPIFESSSNKGILTLVNSFAGGGQSHFWEEYHEPREFWLHLENGDIREKAPPDAVYNYIHVREIR